MCDVEIPLSVLAGVWGGQPAALPLGASIFPAFLWPTSLLAPQDGH